jgi:hypothetical protein
LHSKVISEGKMDRERLSEVISDSEMTWETLSPTFSDSEMTEDVIAMELIETEKLAWPRSPRGSTLLTIPELLLA